MTKKPTEECKYTPLEARLRDFPKGQDALTLSFEQIEQAMNSPLPKSAYIRLTWWNNKVHTGLSHKNAWLNAGLNVAEVNLLEKWVRFVCADDAGVG
jgi:hypothetical protein